MMPSSYKVEEPKKTEDQSGKKDKFEDKRVKADRRNGALKRQDNADLLTSTVKNKMVRNPITGEGFPEGKQKMNSRRRDGNPVLGTGYDVKTQKVNKMPVGGKSTILIT